MASNSTKVLIFGFLCLILLSSVSAFSPARNTPYLPCCVDVLNSETNETILDEVRDSMRNGESVCCKYDSNPNACYECFEEEDKQLLMNNIIFFVYLGFIGVLLVALLVNFKKKFLKPVVKEVIFWALMILLSPILFVLLVSRIVVVICPLLIGFSIYCGAKKFAKKSKLSTKYFILLLLATIISILAFGAALYTMNI